MRHGRPRRRIGACLGLSTRAHGLKTDGAGTIHFVRLGREGTTSWNFTALAMARRQALADGPPSLTVAGGVATLRFERPGEHNRIDPDDIAVLHDHLRRVAALPAVRAVVVRGAGETTFSSGFTVGAIRERLDRSFEDLLDAIEQFPLPTIAVLHGGVYGGATDLALCCDWRIGVRGTRMFMPAARFGLHYYPGGLRRYVGALGLAQAKRIFLTGQTLRAEEMLRIGFLTELVPRGRLEKTLADTLAALAQCEPAVVQTMKRQLNAIAAGDRAGAESRTPYETSLRSQTLQRRLAALKHKRAR
jgi:enoyl-CoA hydratase/carnithine racemase